MKKKLIAGILSLIMAVTPFVSLPAISYADSETCGVKQGATDIFEGMATDDKDCLLYTSRMLCRRAETGSSPGNGSTVTIQPSKTRCPSASTGAASILSLIHISGT